MDKIKELAVGIQATILFFSNGRPRDDENKRYDTI